MKSLYNDEGAIVEGIIYAIVVIATVLVLIIALGPVMHYVMDTLYGNLEQEDTIFKNSDAGFNRYMNMMDTSENVWEMSFIFFIASAILYMIIRAIRKQTYTQRGYR